MEGIRPSDGLQDLSASVQLELEDTPLATELELDLFVTSCTLQDLSSSIEMRYNDTAVHSVPLGINIIGSILNMNALKSQNKTPYPLETTILPFPGLKPEWTYDATAFTSILLIGLALIVIPGGFGILVVAERQVRIK